MIPVLLLEVGHAPITALYDSLTRVSGSVSSMQLGIQGSSVFNDFPIVNVQCKGCAHEYSITVSIIN